MLVPGLLGESILLGKVRYAKKHISWELVYLIKRGGEGCTYLDSLDFKKFIPIFHHSTISLSYAQPQ